MKRILLGLLAVLASGVLALQTNATAVENDMLVESQKQVSESVGESVEEDKQQLPTTLTIDYLAQEAVNEAFSQRMEKERLMAGISARVAASELKKKTAEKILAEKRRAAIVREAVSRLGSKYVWATQGPSAFDCSGFTQYVYGLVGLKINRTSYTQVEHGQEIAFSDLLPSDLIFFTEPDKDRISHVGIYIGDGKFVHAAFGAGQVVVSELSGYYTKYYTTARRLF